jgi:hypothetical protein
LSPPLVSAGGGSIDLDALVEYVEAHSPIGAPAAGRIRNP